MKADVRQVNSIPPQQRALKELAEYGLKFTLLRQPSSWAKAGDIDILVDDVGAFSKSLQRLGYVQLYQSNAHIKYDRTSEQWIHLDVHPTIWFGTIESPREFIERLLDSSYTSEYKIPCLDPTDEAILILFHAALDKGRFDPKYNEKVFSVDMNSILRRGELYSFLPEQLSKYWQWVEAIREGTISEQVAITRIRRSFNFHHPQRPLASRLFQRMKRLLLGPQAVVFLGSDGAGKSILTGLLAKLRWPSIRLQYMGPARESEMHLVFRVPARILSPIRNSYPKNNIIGIFARAGWQLLCYLDFLERVWRHIWFLGSKGVLLCDRYACDMYFRHPSIWNELLFLRMFPRPRFVFLCVGEAEAIHQRKTELTPDEIEYTVEMYRKKLNQYSIPYMELNTTELSPTDTLREAVKHLCNNDWFRDTD